MTDAPDILLFNDGPWGDPDQTHAMAEVHLADTGTAEARNGRVRKRILRTGTWDVTPTGMGKIQKRLTITKDGKSDAAKGIISLAEIKENFDKKLIPNVMVPLSDVRGDDHVLLQNMTKLNTGYVRDLEIEDQGDLAYLMADIEFTEPEVADKVLRGTYADVSAGIPWNVKNQGAALEHVCITNTPFIDGLGPFLAASDQSPAKLNVTHMFLGSEVTPDPDPQPEPDPDPAPDPEPEGDPEGDGDEPPTLDHAQTLAAAQTALGEGQLQLSRAYVAHEVLDNAIVVRHKLTDKSWHVAYTVEKDGTIVLADFAEWAEVKIEEETPPAPEPAPIAASSAPRSPAHAELEAAKALREVRLSKTSPTNKEAPMPLTREKLEALNLSDEEKADLQAVLDENARLAATARTSEADRRIEELKDLGFSEKPGFLKLYRDVMLSDDNGPAVVLLSDNGTERKLTAKEILDQAIDAITVEGKVQFSNQHLNPGHDDPPPPSTDGQRPFEDRLADAKAALGR